MFRLGWIEQFRASILDQSFRYCNTNTCGKIWNLDQVDSLDIVTQYPNLPTVIHLQDIDRNCNLTCASCRLKTEYSHLVNPNSQTILNYIKQSYQDVDYKVLISGDGQGDVFSSAAYREFLNSDDLPDCFEFSFLTNGTLLTKNLDLIERRRHQFNTLTVSFDAATADTYKRIRGANFNIVLDGVRAVQDLGINVTTQFVLQRENYQEVLAYRDLCLELGVAFMGIQRLYRWPHMSDQWWEYNRVDANPYVDLGQLIPALEQFKSTHNAGVDGGVETMIHQYRSDVNA
jgi:MoaA/NifB/PqqE/SkfB family radical SAM enzyme